MEAKEERSFYEKEHEMVMAEFRAHEASISVIYKHHKSSIKRTKYDVLCMLVCKDSHLCNLYRLYFDEADVFDSKLKSIKDNISKLENELHECKRLYSQTLKNLEQISEEIHEKRALKSLKREPGVGAELIDDQNGEYHFISSFCCCLNPLYCSLRKWNEKPRRKKQPLYDRVEWKDAKAISGGGKAPQSSNQACQQMCLVFPARANQLECHKYPL